LHNQNKNKVVPADDLRQYKLHIKKISAMQQRVQFNNYNTNIFLSTKQGRSPMHAWTNIQSRPRKFEQNSSSGKTQTPVESMDVQQEQE
jgi:hypothetical protein